MGCTQSTLFGGRPSRRRQGWVRPHNPRHRRQIAHTQRVLHQLNHSYSLANEVGNMLGQGYIGSRSGSGIRGQALG